MLYSPPPILKASSNKDHVFLTPEWCLAYCRQLLDFKSRSKSHQSKFSFFHWLCLDLSYVLFWLVLFLLLIFKSLVFVLFCFLIQGRVRTWSNKKSAEGLSSFCFLTPPWWCRNNWGREEIQLQWSLERWFRKYGRGPKGQTSIHLIRNMNRGLETMWGNLTHTFALPLWPLTKF